MKQWNVQLAVNYITETKKTLSIQFNAHDNVYLSKQLFSIYNYNSKIAQLQGEKSNQTLHA